MGAATFAWNKSRVAQASGAMRDRCLRIGVDIATLRPPFTGIANYEIQLLRRLLGLMPEATFTGFGVYRWEEIDEAFLTACGSAEISLARRKASLLRYSTTAHALRNKVRQTIFSATSGQQKLDLYHAFSYRPAGRIKAPVVPVVYDLSTVRHPETHPKSRLRWLSPLEKLCQTAPFVHTISAFSASEITSIFGVPADRIIIAPPGVSELFLNPKPPAPAMLRRFGLSPGSYVLTVSTLEPRKNLKSVIEAFAALSTPIRIAMPLVVAGARGWGSIDLPASAGRLESEGSLLFTGYVSDQELRCLYAGARSMFYPSLYEGFGMPITEALGCGTPVVASATSSMPEAGGDQARYVNPLDIDRWRSEFEYAFGATLHLDTQARLARHAYARRLSWDRSAETIAAMYRQILM